MEYVAAKELQDKRGNQSGKHAMVGLDGFVDTIIHLVAKRHALGDDFSALKRSRTSETGS